MYRQHIFFGFVSNAYYRNQLRELQESQKMTIEWR